MRWLAVWWLAFGVLVVLLGCADSKGKSEAAMFVRRVDAVRMAPNEHKRGPFDELKASSCSADDVCSARKACVEAFEHHVRGIELTAELQKQMSAAPQGALSKQDQGNLGQKLLEANIELEQARELQPTCDQLVSDLRIKRKI